MKFKKIIQYSLLISLAAVLLYVFFGLKKKEQGDFVSELTADGEGMVHRTYNNENRESMVLKCSQSERVNDDKLILKDINGLIKKKGRMHQDIHVTGKTGYVANNNLNFYVEKDAKLESKDFFVTSDNFLLKDQAIMSTDKKVEYSTKKMTGIAKEGMELYLKINVLKFFKTRGHYQKDNRDFKFKTDILWIIDEKKWVVMEKKAVIREKNSILRSDQISAEFIGDFKHIKRTIAHKNSYFFLRDPEKEEVKEIKAGNISSQYDDSGRMQKTTILQNGEIFIKNKENQTFIASNLIEMYFDVENGQLSRVEIPYPGQIENTGKSNFRVSADKIHADYNVKGELNYCESLGNSEFNFDDYKGTADNLYYNVTQNTIKIEEGIDGEETQIINKNNTFNSSRFTVNTEKNSLVTDDGVKSIILLKKKNVLFSPDPIFINSKLFGIYNDENKINYQKQVNLIQNDITLRTQNLEINDDNKIVAMGNVSLGFTSQEKEITIKGDRFIFNAEAGRIDIDNNAGIMFDDTVLTANHIEVLFDENNEIKEIVGLYEIRFYKDELTGTSGRVIWDFKAETMVFRELPQIVKRNGGTTIGEVLKINLKSNKITILSSKTERTETIIEQ